MSRWDVDHILEVVAAEARSLEKVRQDVLAQRNEGKKKLLIVLAIAVLSAVVMMAVSSAVMGLATGVILGGVGGLIVHQVYFAKGMARYQDLFKRQYLTRVVKSVEPSMDYQPHRWIDEELFNRSGLFATSPDRYSGEDLFHGTIGKTKVTFSEIHAEEKRRRTDSKGRTKTYWVTIFRGIFFIADFHKDFRSPVTVMPDVAEKHLGWFGKKLQNLGGNLQRLENPEFEKMFVVRGSDAVEARYILTPAMQEQLVDLGRRVGDDLRVVFRDSLVCLAIPNQEDWFEGNLHHPIGDPEQARRILAELRSCFIIVDELDLNTRIWTKE